MGLLDKVKNMFTDEVEEEPIKSERIPVEIPAPAKVVEESVSDNENIQTEEKPTTPIFFDDDYFKELETPKQEVKSSYLKEQTKEKMEKRIFKPTPVISPVYGVLDKNYSKEDIRPKHESKKPTSTSTNIDDVRKKAFGTLEDDLETTLFGNNSILFNDVIEEPKEEVDLFEELTEPVKEDATVVDNISHEDETIDIFEDIEAKDSSDKKEETIKENELFDLIDSMYEKGE